LLFLQLHCSRHHWILDRAIHSTSRHCKILTGIVRQITIDQRERRKN
jgi:membrane-associated PAP2 superfamily phosphatase